ncbi:hypothetical protein BC940DRAFT_292563 [Gongronella butleri]|nr:hypothetical protein BC940DRAFT_292563 [Gongronella butleri]
MDKWEGSFAKTQLEKYGWEHGGGLGKDGSGVKKHINVVKKNDKKGVGVTQGHWDFAWWDHLYNKSASEVSIENEESGSIKVAKKKSTGDDLKRSKTGIYSTERPTSNDTKESAMTASMTAMADQVNNDTVDNKVKNIQASLSARVAKNALYGGFVKSSSGVYDPSAPSPLTGSNDVDANDFKDYSVKMTDAELFDACEGRTARKGGRGLVEQKGKFARVMQDFVRTNDDVATIGETKRKLENEAPKSNKKIKKDKKAKKAKKDKKTKKEKKEKK